MAGDRAELHVGHDREPEGRRAAPPRRLSECLRQCAHVRVVAAQCLSLDAADVPLQRLDLHLGGDAGRWHACLSPPRGAGTDLRRNCRVWRDAYVRRTGGAEHADPRARGSAPGIPPDGADRHRRRGTSVHGDRAHGGDGFRGDPSLRSDGKLWSVHGMHVAARPRRHADRAEILFHGAAGREHADAGGCGGARSRQRWRRSWRTARRWAS